MSANIKIVHLERNIHEHTLINQFGTRNAAKAQSFHQSFPEYGVTPLVELNGLAQYLGLGKILVKDESPRFGLNAFKGLGASFAIGRYIADRLGADISDLSYEKITRDSMRNKLGDLTFVTATDGNHGRGVAWTALQLGFKSVVYMPKGSAVERLNNIRALGAKAEITSMNYDDTVRFARCQAEENGWILIQDTAWEGYETIPGLIMQGYTTIGHEIVNQLDKKKLTHIFLQAGVGAMAGAMTGFFTDFHAGQTQPVITIVEPDKADCLFRTADAKDGQLHCVTDDMDTIMAGLACGEPCTIAWDILNKYADNFLSVPDAIAAKGMRVLGNPLGGDPQIISGESGAVTLGVVTEIMLNPRLSGLKETLGLNSDSVVLFISTEGDTDREHYRKIVWDGLHPSYG